MRNTSTPAFSVRSHASSHYNSTFSRSNAFNNPNLQRLHYETKIKPTKSKSTSKSSKNILQKRGNSLSTRTLNTPGSIAQRDMNSKQGKSLQKSSSGSKIPTFESNTDVVQALDEIMLQKVEDDSPPQQDPVEIIMTTLESPSISVSQVDKTPEIETQGDSKDGVAQQCVLDHPDCPPFSQLDHYTHRCYCYLCTCGKHICPGGFVANTSSARSVWTSSYNHDFKNSRPNVPEKAKEQPQIVLSKLPMQLTSTQRSDFKKPKTPASPVKMPARIDPPTKYLPRSSYAACYANWGPFQPENFSPKNLPYRGQETHFEGQTTYGNDYVTNRRNLNSAPRIARSSSMPFGDEFYDDTTSRVTYGPIKPSILTNSASHIVKEKPLILSNVAYRSMNSGEFQGKQPKFLLPKRNTNA